MPMTKSGSFRNSVFVLSDQKEKSKAFCEAVQSEIELNFLYEKKDLERDTHLSLFVCQFSELDHEGELTFICQFAKIKQIPILLISDNLYVLKKFQEMEYHYSSVLLEPAGIHLISERIIYLTDQYQNILKSRAEIEERKRAELALNLIKSRYKVIAQNTNDGVFDWNFKNNKVFYSLQWKHLLGYRSKDISQSITDWLDLVHPEDCEIFESIMMRLKNNIHDSAEFKFRIKHKTKGYRWYKLHGTPIKDTNGNTIRCAGTISDITELRETESSIVHASLHDGLTGLANKEFFLKTLNRFLLQKSRSPNRSACIFYLDIDEFKKINDHLGHIKSDQLLIMVAARLKSILRADDFIARIAGDEFAALLEYKGEEMEALEIANKVQRHFSNAFTIEDQNIFLTISIGICLIDKTEDKPEDLLRNSEIAMNRSKDNGFKQIGFFQPIMRKKATEHFMHENRLRNAIRNNELKLEYQPIVDSKNKKMTGVEALLRWQENGKNILPPLQVIRIAEGSGIIMEIGKWVLEEACKMQVQWEKLFNEKIRISVNCSAEQFKNESYLSEVKSILADSEIDPAYLNLELTESVFIGNEVSSIKLLNSLKELGVSISIDDFGTGYSSLSYLSKFPLDYLKIDRSFIMNYPDNKTDAEITQTIISMSKNLNLQVIGEGIETEEQLAFLCSSGCDLHQGYFYSKPVPAETISEYLTCPPNHW